MTDLGMRTEYFLDRLGVKDSTNISINLLGGFAACAFVVGIGSGC